MKLVGPDVVEDGTAVHSHRLYAQGYLARRFAANAADGGA